jgi:hypothetical protein
MWHLLEGKEENKKKSQSASSWWSFEFGNTVTRVKRFAAVST